MLKLGTQNISALYVGGAKIKRALVGTEVVYEAVRPPTVYTISAVVAPASGGSVTGAGQYQEGETVTLTYTPAEDHRFTGWYAGSTLLSQANPYTFAAAQDIAVTAKCEEIPTYTLTLAPTGISAQNWSFSIAVNGSGITWSGSGAAASSPAPQRAVVKEGSVTVQATSPDGYEFAGWQIGSGSVITSNPYTFTVTGDTTLYCRYAKKSRLPAGYTELEYIEAGSASSNICFKGDSLNTNTGSTFNIKVYIPSITNSTFSKDVLLGSNSTASAYRLNLKIFSGKWNADFHYGKLSYTELTGFPISGLLEFKVTYGDKKISLNTSYSKALSSVSGFSAGANGFTVNSTHATGFRFYGMSCSSTTSTSANYNWEIVPCKNASGAIGYYILGKGKFYSKVTSVYTAGLYGTWTAGPAV
jgi:hypothetical protein